MDEKNTVAQWDMQIGLVRLDVKFKRGDSVEFGDQPSLKVFAVNNVTLDLDLD